MRVESLFYKVPDSGSTSPSLTWALRSLAEKGSLKAVVSGICGTTLFLKLGGREVGFKLPKEHDGGFFAVGTAVWLALAGENSVVVRPLEVDFTDRGDVYSTAKPAQVLEHLGIQASPAAVSAAEALLENGLPLAPDFIKALLPWAGPGRLNEAVLLLKAGFPLTPELVAAAEKLGNTLVFPAVKSHLKDSLQEQLSAYPSRQNRSLLGEEISEGPLKKSLGELFAQEQLANSLAGQHSLAGVLFALPFLLGGDLAAAWLQVTEDRAGGLAEDAKDYTVFFKIPTQNLGEIVGKLTARGKKVGLLLYTEKREGRPPLKAALAALKQKLTESGWQPQRLAVAEEFERWFAWK